MNNLTNKLQGIGLDLRKVTNSLPKIHVDNPSEEIHSDPDPSMFYLDYVMVDLLYPYPHLIHEVVQNVIVNEGILIVYVDFSKFDTTIDPWIQAYELWKQWKSGYWRIPSGSVTFIFENLPEFSDKFLGNKLWKEDSEIKYLGLVISKQDGWLEEEKLWRKWLESTPEVIARPINPLFYNHELEEWCKLGKAITIGLDWDGGLFNYPILEEIFGDHYLLEFSAYYSKIVLYPLYKNYDYRDQQRLTYLRDIILKELDETEVKKFELNKNVSRLSKIPKRLIYESFRIDVGNEVWTIPINKYSEIFYPSEETEFSFKSPKIEIETTSGREDFELSDLEYRVKQEINISLTPPPTSFEVAWKTALLSSVSIISEEFKEKDGWNLEFCALGLNSIVINAIHIKKKTWLTKHLPDEIDKQKSFLLVMKSPESIYFFDMDSIENLQKKKEKQR